MLHNLYDYTKTSLTTLLLLSLIFVVFLIGKVPSILLFIWSVLSISVTASRIYDAKRFLEGRSPLTIEDEYRRFTYKAYLTAFLWGAMGLVVFSYIEDSELRMMVFIFILGIGGGATTSISSDPKLTKIYLFMLMAPIVGYFIYLGDKDHFIMAFLISAYYALLLNVSRRIGETLLNNIEQQERYRVTQEKLYDKQDELDSLFKNAPVGVFYYNNDMRIVDFNDAFLKLYGSDPDILRGLDLYKLPDQRPVKMMEDALTKGPQIYRGPYNPINGGSVWTEAKASPVINSKGETIGGVVIIENKTEEKEALDELYFMARHDALTSLSNRRYFTEFMHSMVSKEEHQDHYSVLFYLDLNQFKNINDTLGHSVGDQLLIEVAGRLRNLVGDEYNLSRLGGDEFVIIMPYVATTEEEAKEWADRCSQNLKKVFHSAFLIEDMHLYIKSSIGIVIIEPGVENIDEIIRHADISMYSAKHKGKDTIAYYNAKLDEERRELFRLQHDLQHAIENEQLTLYYQPIVSIKDDQLIAAEALLRWPHDKHGIVLPGQFIPLAIESGLIDDIGWLVIELVCRQIAEWKEDAFHPLDYISINVNAVQLQRTNFIKRFFAILDKYGVVSREIKLEITENSLIENFEQTIEIIGELKRRGIRCAIDDFGTGYSSLSYLKKFSFSVLKIDREFIKDILERPDDIVLVKSIILIGKQLGYHIVVEGIETEAQKKLLMEIDEDLRYQGFLFSRPLSASDFKDRFCTNC